MSEKNDEGFVEVRNLGTRIREVIAENETNAAVVSYALSYVLAYHLMGVAAKNREIARELIGAVEEEIAFVRKSTGLFNS